VKRQNSKPRIRSAHSAAQTSGSISRWRRFGLSALVLALVVVSAWIAVYRNTTALPHVDLQGLDPRVAEIIKVHLQNVRDEPRSAQAWGSLGSVLQTYSMVAPARICLAEAERIDPKEPRWPYFQSLLLTSEAPEQALAKLCRAVELCGNVPEAPRWRLASLLAEAGRWDEAERELEELLRAKPDFTPAILVRARRAQAQGNLSEAVALARRCSEDPRTARSAAVLLANLYLRQGDTNSAVMARARIASLPADQSVGDPYLAEAARLRGDPRVLTEQAHPLLAAGRTQEAASVIQQLQTEHSDYPETWLLVGRLQILKKDFGAAEQSLQRHLELDPQSIQGVFQLGLAQMGLGRFDVAAETFSKATVLKPDFGPAFYNQGFAFTRTGKFREAVPPFREAIRFNPERIDSYLMLADTHIRIGESDEALKVLQQAEPLNPSHPGLRQLREKADRTRQP
jgi:tetratricopeptide (TPR) repeat protein